MAINSSTKKVVSKKLIKVIETKAQASVLVDEQKGVDKVLSVACLPSVVSNDLLGEFLQISGKCDIDVCFADREKNLDTQKEVVEFSERVQVGSFENVYVVPRLKKVQYKQAGVNLIDVVATIDLSVWGALVEEISPIEANNEGCVEKCDKLLVQTLSASASQKFDISEDVEILGVVDKVLATSVRLSSYRTIPMDNYAKVDGCVEIDIVGLFGGIVKKSTHSIDFVQEISVLNLKQDDLVDDSVVVDSIQFAVNVAEEQGRTILSVTAGLQANIFAFAQNEIDVVTDLFSLNKKLNYSTECFNNEKFTKKQSSSERLNLSVDMKESRRMDEILFVGEPILNVAQTGTANDGVQVSGSIMQNIVFKNYDVDDILSSVVEVPFSCVLGLVDSTEEQEFSFDIKCNSFKNKVGKEIDFNYELVYESKTIEKKYECFVSKVEELDELNKNENSVVIYMPANGEDLYAISKELRVSPDTILAQNPNYVEGAENNKVVVYLQKK